MPTPLSYLLHTITYEQEDIKKIIEKYPNVIYTNSRGPLMPGEVHITGNMMVEFEAIFTKLIDCAKNDLGGSPDVDKIGPDYYKNNPYSYMGPHWTTHDYPLIDVLEKKVFYLLDLCSKAILYRKTLNKKIKEEQNIANIIVNPPIDIGLNIKEL